MTSLQQKIGTLEWPSETKPLSRVNRWFLSTTYSIVRCGVTVAYLAAVIAGDMKDPIGILAVTAAYAILMLLLWLHERYPPRL